MSDNGAFPFGRRVREKVQRTPSSVSKGRWEVLTFHGVDWSYMGPEWASGRIEVFRKKPGWREAESFEPEINPEAWKKRRDTQGVFPGSLK